MRKVEIEAWALQIMDALVKGRRIEDSRVECKREWPSDPGKAARRIAGHANAARADRILWLIGVDEDAGTVTGAASDDFADWWNQVKSQFDGLAPNLIENFVPYDDTMVVALLFETADAPYVVRNYSGKGHIDFEVPWREGTHIRSARRQDLVKILVPLSHAPEIEFRPARLTPYLNLDGFEVEPSFYIVPREPFVVPRHRIKIEYSTTEGFTNFQLSWFEILFEGRPYRERELFFAQPDTLAFHMKATYQPMKRPPQPADEFVHITVLFRPALEKREFTLHTKVTVGWEGDVPSLSASGWATV